MLSTLQNDHAWMVQCLSGHVAALADSGLDDVVDFFDKYMIKNPQVLDPVKKALETLDIRSKFLEFMK